MKQIKILEETDYIKAHDRQHNGAQGQTIEEAVNGYLAMPNAKIEHVDVYNMAWMFVISFTVIKLTNNIADYFNKASYGNVTLSPAIESFGVADNGVVGWVDLGYRHPNTGSNTGSRNQLITKNAILAGVVKLA